MVRCRCEREAHGLVRAGHQTSRSRLRPALREVVVTLVHAPVWLLASLASCGESMTAPQGTAATQVAVGLDHACALDSRGRIRCWGGNREGQLGIGSTAESFTPTEVSTDVRFTSVAAGGILTCGISVDSIAYCWGSLFVPFSPGGDSVPLRPAEIPNHRWRSLSLSIGYVCGVQTDGLARCWGGNSHGQLGITELARTVTPVLVDSTTRFTRVVAGPRHACAVTVVGQVMCWGLNYSGQIGNGSAHTGVEPPALVMSDERFAEVAVGGDHTCALTSDGTPWCWGDNSFGQLAWPQPGASRVPRPAVGGPRFRGITAGAEHTCGVSDDGQVYCWGRNFFGQLGDGTRQARATILPVAGGARFSSVAAGQSFTCAIAVGGVPWCWGHNGGGQLGDGSRDSRQLPAPTYWEP